MELLGATARSYALPCINPSGFASSASSARIARDSGDRIALMAQTNDNFFSYLTNIDTRRFGASGAYTEEGETAVDGILLRILGTIGTIDNTTDA